MVKWMIFFLFVLGSLQAQTNIEFGGGFQYKAEYESLYTIVGLDFHYQIRNYEFTDTYNGVGSIENTPLLLTPYVQENFKLFNWSSLFSRLRIVGLKMATVEVGLLFTIKKD